MAESNPKKKQIPLIIFIIVLIVIAVVTSILYRNRNLVPKNPAGTVGNTAGNIYNSGYFCENNGKIYFANSYDNNSLYSMNSDGSDIKCLVKANTKYINAGGKYLYYYMADSGNATGLGFVRRVMGIYRCKNNGKNVQTVSRSPSLDMILVDNFIYYQHYDNKTAVSLYKISTDGKKDIKISEDIITPAGIDDDIIYFANQNDNHFLEILDTTNDSITEYLRYNVWNPIRYDNYIYFMDIENNMCLSRYDITNDKIEILTSDAVDCYNLNNSYIFYQKNSVDSPEFIRMSLDGSSKETIAEGNYTAINVTSNYVYFRPFDNEMITYRTPAYGSVNVTEFTEAAIAMAAK